MIKKLLLFSFLFFGILTAVSQDKKVLIIGKITDSLSTVKNANIINLKTKQGTFSNEDGLFRIFASKGDTLQISSVQHISKKIGITKQVLDVKNLSIVLRLNVVTLDEFELRKHNLKGKLALDVNAVPKDKKDSLLRDLLDFSNIDFTKKDFTIDANVRMKPPIVNTMAGAMPMAGAGASATIPFAGMERLRLLKIELERKKAFPYRILSELGDQFFFDELKIPVDKYFHFLEYCNPLGIEKLHKEGKILELIKILRTESESYHKIIKNE